MNSLFQGFLNALKARITPIWTKIRLFTNPSYLKGEVLRRLINYFRNMTDVRPRDKKDYYGIFGWLVSKRLAFLIVVVIGMCATFYITVVQPLSAFTTEDGIKTYSYHSIPLRFTEGKVRILGKSDYLAYEGNVADGYAEGMGTLYRKDGSTVYEGQFEKNEFHGTGTSYYPTGQVQYTGAFQHNVYSGAGRLFRESGSLEYEGAFLEGLKDGEGTLYDAGNNKVYVGNFSKGNLLYADFLGKSTAETNQMYVGQKTVYTDDTYFVVDMPDIDAVYYGVQGEENLADEIMVEGVYVLKDSFAYGTKELTHVAEIAQIMGDAIYEGNAYLITPEAVAIHTMNQTKNVLNGDVTGKWEQYLTDAVIVNGYDKDYSVYIYTYVMDDMRYTFFCKDRSGQFAMYLIEKQE